MTVLAPELHLRLAGPPIGSPGESFDCTFDVSNLGQATAKAVPGADLLILEEMGHDLPEPLWPQVVGAIAANAKKAG